MLRWLWKSRSMLSKLRSSRIHSVVFQLLSDERLSYSWKLTRQWNWTIRLSLRSNKGSLTLSMSANRPSKSTLRIKDWLSETLKLKELTRTRSTCLRRRFRQRSKWVIGNVNETRSRKRHTGGKSSIQTVSTEPTRNESIRYRDLQHRQPLRVSNSRRPNESISWLKKSRKELRSVISSAEDAHSTQTRMSRRSTSVIDISTRSWNATIRSMRQRLSLTSREAQPFD